MDWLNSSHRRALAALPVLFASLLLAPLLLAGSLAAQTATSAQSPSAASPFGLPGGDPDAGQVTTPDLRGTTAYGGTASSSSSFEPDFNRPSSSQFPPVLRGSAGSSTSPAADPGASTLANSANDTLARLDPDQRSQNERAAFERPPAGYDPAAFQIETVVPGRDRRTEKFFEADPFSQIGWRLGPFILFQELEASPAWDANVFLSANPQSDWLAAFRSETRIVSNWSNHAVEFRMLQNRTYHNKFSSENEASQLYELRGRLDITSRTTAEGLIAREVRQESRNSVDSSSAVTSSRPDVITDRVTVTFNHRFNRLSLQLRGGLAETDYEGDTNSRDVRTETLAMRAQWEFRPEFSIFGEYERDSRRHPSVNTTDNVSRNSTGDRYRVGVALGQTGEYLRGEASLGYGVQRPEASSLPDVQAFLVDANVAWRITPLASVLFDARTTIDETTLTGSGGVISRSLGVRMRHSYTERLIGEAGVTYTTQSYPGATLQENNWRLRTLAEYTANRHLALFTRFEHVRFRSNSSNRDYNDSTVMFGVRLRN